MRFDVFFKAGDLRCGMSLGVLLSVVACVVFCFGGGVGSVCVFRNVACRQVYHLSWSACLDLDQDPTKAEVKTATVALSSRACVI